MSLRKVRDFNKYDVTKIMKLYVATTTKEMKAILLERKRKETRMEEGANNDLEEMDDETMPNPIKWLSIGLELEDAL